MVEINLSLIWVIKKNKQVENRQREMSLNAVSSKPMYFPNGNECSLKACVVLEGKWTSIWTKAALEMAKHVVACPVEEVLTQYLQLHLSAGIS